MNIDDFDAVEAGRRLGHDLHRLSAIAPQPHWPLAVREGFAAAAAGRGARPRHDDRFVRKWLQLRLGALARGRAVATRWIRTRAEDRPGRAGQPL